MMKVKVEQICAGIHPSEVVVAIRTIEGTENLVVSRRSLEADRIDVGYPIRYEDDAYLIELPRESLSGSWRVWVRSDQVIQEERLRA